MHVNELIVKCNCIRHKCLIVLMCGFSPKIIIHLSSPAPDKPPGPVVSSQNSYVRLSFKEGGEKDVRWCLLVLFECCLHSSELNQSVSLYADKLMN